MTETFQVEFNGEKWEVDSEAKRIMLRDLKIPNGKQLMPFNLAIFLHDNDLIKIHKEYELIQQISKKNLKKGYKYSVLYSYGRQLHVGGNSWDDNVGGCAFGVRFCRRLE